MKKALKFVVDLFIILLLTVVTQIGGVVYFLTLFVQPKNTYYRWKRLGTFVFLYLTATFLVVPLVAPLFGREKINKQDYVASRTFMTDVLNRNYVRPELNISLQKIATELNKKHQGVKVVYLDANFPFINKFPLLPHLSHSDGKKVDLSLIYEDENKRITNKKPSVSGYGVFEAPKEGAYDQIKRCLSNGNWQYDFPKYFTFGTINPKLSFSEVGTRDLILEILKQPNTGKIFIEPHLKSRLNLSHKKIRFHGCQAVRHDDHIHFQLH